MKFISKETRNMNTIEGATEDFIKYVSEQDPDVILVVCYMKKEINYACVECQKKVLVSMSIELHEEIDKSGVDESWADFIYGQGNFAEEEKDLAEKVQAVEDEIHDQLIRLMWQSHKGEYDYDKL